MTDYEHIDPPAPANPLEERMHELREQAKTYAKAEAERVYLDHYRHSKLAILMKEVEERTGLKTVAAQEREARSHPDYIQLLRALREATEVAEREGWLLRIAMRGSSLYQTQEATKRAELRAYSSGTS